MRMLKALIGCFALSLTSASFAQAASLTQFLAKLPGDNDAKFTAAKVVDLSVYQTMSKWQPPLGSCTVFSVVGAVEAAYTRKYCDKPSSQFHKAGYCQRYEALKAANMTPFYLVDHPWFDSDKKAIDLSEQYFLNRVLSMWVTSPTSNHESGNLFCFLDGLEQGVAGDTAFILNNLRLPEESDVPYIYDADFYDKANVEVCKNISQDKIDAYHFSENMFSMKDWDGSAISRMFTPQAGYRHAVYGVKDLFFMDKSSYSGDMIVLLEKTLFAGYEVAVSGAQPGHSMLLTGYDRTNKKFLFKDHYQRWVTVNYDDLSKSVYEMSVVLDVENDYLQPSRQEMWLGPWEMDLDGRPGKLIIRRNQTPSNALYSTNAVSGQNMTPIPTTKWARLGTFFENGVTRRTVYGRFNGGDGTTMELNIDFSKVEGPADPLSVVAQGYQPTGQPFTLRMFPDGDGAASYAAGQTIWEGKPYGVLLRRPSYRPYPDFTHVAATSFDRKQWVHNFALVYDRGGKASLELTSKDGMKTVTGTILEANAQPVTVVGQFAADNHVKLTTQGAMPGYSLDLFYHTWEKGVVSGTITRLMNTVAPLYGVEAPYTIAPKAIVSSKYLTLKAIDKPALFIPAMEAKGWTALRAKRP